METPLPTPAQAEVFRAYVETGSQKEAARRCGIALSTAKNHLSQMYDRLGVGGAMEAATVLGWVSLPGAAPKACGWVGYCSRPIAHRGHHGGMRAFDPNAELGGSK